MLIDGATGSYSDIVNGAYKVAERPHNEPPIYSRADDEDSWLFVDKDGQWAVGDTSGKDTRKTSARCTAHSVEAAEGRLPEEVAAAWQVWNSREFTEQLLRVLHGEEAEAAIAEVCVYAPLMHCPLDL